MTVKRQDRRQVEIQGDKQPEKCGSGPVDRHALKKITFSFPSFCSSGGERDETVAWKMAWPQEDRSEIYRLMMKRRSRFHRARDLSILQLLWELLCIVAGCFFFS